MLVGADEINHGQQELFTEQIACNIGTSHRMQSELPTKSIFANLSLVSERRMSVCLWSEI
jgi:hypothetical protein